MKKSFQLFDSFNARHSSFEEIAQTFVSNDDFFAIAKNNHTFIIGPRGCGKTTMFKMLSPSAQHYWKPTSKEEVLLKNNLPFIAIYIPSDELWKDQLRKITQPISKDLDLLLFITNALINVNILSNFCTNIKNYLEISNLNEQSGKEYKFCIKLIKAWKLENCVATLSDINLAINIRKDNLLNKLKSYIFNTKFGKEKELTFEEYYHADFLDSLKNGILAFEDVYFDGHSKKWALCFDELELVSLSFINVLISKLRITPSNIVFKLSSGPLTNFISHTAQMFHDYEVVKMWPFSPMEEYRYMEFCEEIARRRIDNHLAKNNIKNQDLNFELLFGSSDYKKVLKKEFNFNIKEVKEIEAGSLTWFAFKELANLDKSFLNTLKSNNINPDNPIPETDSINSSFHRKVKEIVINRLIFNKYKNGEYSGQRPRKEYLIYYGKETIFRICEGNPRFIINIVNELLSEIQNFEKLEFTPELQANVIKSVSSRFNAMLNTFPTSAIYDGKPIDLKWIIQKIGKYFAKEINEGMFNINPSNSFLIKPDNIKPVLLKLIKTGTGLGAFIKIDKTSNDIDVGNQTRFRLSYLLNPEFKLPLRLYSSVKLNKIVPHSSINIEPNLFDLDEN